MMFRVCLATILGIAWGLREARPPERSEEHAQKIKNYIIITRLILLIYVPKIKKRISFEPKNNFLNILLDI